MAMVFLTDRKLNNNSTIDNNNHSAIIKENNKISLSQTNMNMENMISIPRIKAPFNIQSKGHDYLDKLNKNPGPGAYNLENDFLKPQLNALENMNFMANTPRFINKNKELESNPGPGSYNINDKPLFKKRIYNRPNSNSNKLNNNYKYNSINSVSSIPSKNHNYGYLENEEGELIQAIVPVSEDYFSGEKNNSVGPGRYYIYFHEKNPIVKWNRMSARVLNVGQEKKSEKDIKKLKNESLYSVNSDLSKVDTDISFVHNRERENKFEYKKFTTKNLMDKYKKNLNASNANVHSIKKKEEEEDQFDIERELEFLNSNENKIKKGLYPSYNYNQMRYQYKPIEQQFFGSTVERGITHIPFNEKLLYPGPGSYFHQTFRDFEKRKNLKKNISTFAKSKRTDFILKKSTSALGPGSYNITKIDSYKKKSFNKFGNFSCEKRFPDIYKNYDDKGKNTADDSPDPGNYEIGNLWKKNLEKKQKKLIFVNVEREMKKHLEKKKKESKPDFNSYQNQKMINLIQTKINSKINPYSSKHNPFLSGLGRFKIENEQDLRTNVGPGRYNLSKNLGKDYSKSTIIAPFNSNQEKDKGYGSYINENNVLVSPQEYQQDSYFDWNKKSFNIMFV